jgi:hypothetical protein
MNFDQRAQGSIRQDRSFHSDRAAFFEADTIVAVQRRWKSLQMEKY